MIVKINFLDEFLGGFICTQNGIKVKWWFSYGMGELKFWSVLVVEIGSSVEDILQVQNSHTDRCSSVS